MASLNELTEFMDCCYAAKSKLKKIAKKSNVDIRVTLHWTAGTYDQTFNSYHVNILGDGTIKITEPDFSIILSHTYYKNTANIGITMCCGADMTDKKAGKYPPTSEQIESMAQLMAVASEVLELPIDVHHFPSHGEAADNDDYVVNYPDYTGYPNNAYGPKSSFDRWDCLTLWTDESPYSDPFNPEIRGETILRGKAIWYRQYYYGH